MKRILAAVIIICCLCTACSTAGNESLSSETAENGNTSPYTDVNWPNKLCFDTFGAIRDFKEILDKSDEEINTYLMAKGFMSDTFYSRAHIEKFFERYDDLVLLHLSEESGYVFDMLDWNLHGNVISATYRNDEGDNVIFRFVIIDNSTETSSLSITADSTVLDTLTIMNQTVNLYKPNDGSGYELKGCIQNANSRIWVYINNMDETTTISEDIKDNIVSYTFGDAADGVTGFENNDVFTEKDGYISIPKFGIEKQRMYCRTFGYDSGADRVVIIPKEFDLTTGLSEAFLVAQIGNDFIKYDLGNWHYNSFGYASLRIDDIDNNDIDEIILLTTTTGNIEALAQIFKIKNNAIELLYDLNKFDLAIDVEYKEGHIMNLKNESLGLSGDLDISEEYDSGRFDENGKLIGKAEVRFLPIDSLKVERNSGEAPATIYCERLVVLTDDFCILKVEFQVDPDLNNLRIVRMETHQCYWCLRQKQQKLRRGVGSLSCGGCLD